MNPECHHGKTSHIEKISTSWCRQRKLQGILYAASSSGDYEYFLNSWQSILVEIFQPAAKWCTDGPTTASDIVLCIQYKCCIVACTQSLEGNIIMRLYCVLFTPLITSILPVSHNSSTVTRLQPLGRIQKYKVSSGCRAVACQHAIKHCLAATCDEDGHYLECRQVQLFCCPS